jgi:hypothetical protein
VVAEKPVLKTVRNPVAVKVDKISSAGAVSDIGVEIRPVRMAEPYEHHYYLDKHQKSGRDGDISEQMAKQGERIPPFGHNGFLLLLLYADMLIYRVLIY